MIQIFNRPRPETSTSWLVARLSDELPRVLLEKALQCIETIMDPVAPPWKRALLLGVLLELLTRANVRLPLGLVVRYVVLHGVLSARLPFALPKMDMTSQGHQAAS